MVWSLRAGLQLFGSIPRDIQVACDVRAITHATTWTDTYLPSRDDDDLHASPPNSIRIITMDFGHGFCAAMEHGMVDLLRLVQHDVLIMTRCQIQPANRTHKQYINAFKRQTQYANVKYNTKDNDADVMVATMAQTLHFPYLGENIQHTAGLPSSTANYQHRSSVLNTSYTSMPLDILVASANADSSQVVQRLAQLRHPNRNRANRHVILITAPERQQDPLNLHQMQAPYANIDLNRYGYDYPLWHTTNVSLFRILAPPIPHPTADTEQPSFIEACFAAVGVAMELRVIQLPPKPGRQRLPITPAEWRIQDHSNTSARIIREPTTKSP